MYYQNKMNVVVKENELKYTKLNNYYSTQSDLLIFIWKNFIALHTIIINESFNDENEKIINKNYEEIINKIQINRPYFDDDFLEEVDRFFEHENGVEFFKFYSSNVKELNQMFAYLVNQIRSRIIGK